MNVRCQREWLLLIYFIGVHWGFKPWHPLGILRHLGVVNLPTLGLRLRRLRLLLVVRLLLVRQVLLLRYDRSAIHPVECDEQRRIDLGHVRCLNQLALNIVEVRLLVVGYGPNVLE